MRFIAWLMIIALASLSATPLAAEPNAEAERAFYVLTRLGYGPSGDDVARVAHMGVDTYIEQQLHPEQIPLPASLQQQIGQFHDLTADAGQLLARDRELTEQRKTAKQDDDAANKMYGQQLNEPVREARDARLILAIESPRQLQEILVDFWYNHFNVYSHKEIDRAFIPAYEDQAIRPYVFGHFRDMLGATAKHPAMLYYLDNWKNVAPPAQPAFAGQPAVASAAKSEVGINENYAREVMELHTLGVNGGYTQQDVTQLARILSGWGIGVPPPPQKKPGFFGRVSGANDTQQAREEDKGHFYFNPAHHDTGDKVFLGRQFHNAGQAEGEAALDMLAYSPVTAHHLSYELAQFFVADEPPDTLVKRMAATWMQTKGDLREVMRTLLKSPEFWDMKYRGAKYRTPLQYVVASVRASGAPIATQVLANQLNVMGEELYGCLTPDGYKNTMDAWLNPTATEQRLSFATAVGSGRLQAVVPPAPDGAQPAQTKPAPVVPLDPARIKATLYDFFSANTQQAVMAAPPELQAALVLGSPEMMRR